MGSAEQTHSAGWIQHRGRDSGIDLASRVLQTPPARPRSPRPRFPAPSVLRTFARDPDPLHRGLSSFWDPFRVFTPGSMSRAGTHPLQPLLPMPASLSSRSRQKTHHRVGNRDEPLGNLPLGPGTRRSQLRPHIAGVRVRAGAWPELLSEAVPQPAPVRRVPEPARSGGPGVPPPRHFPTLERLRTEPSHSGDPPCTHPSSRPPALQARSMAPRAWGAGPGHTSAQVLAPR